MVNPSSVVPFGFDIQPLTFDELPAFPLLSYPEPLSLYEPVAVRTFLDESVTSPSIHS